MNALTVDVYKHPDEFQSDVVELFAAVSQGNVEVSTQWFNNLVDQVYPADSGVRFPVLRKNGAPVAALPIRVSKGALGWQVEALSNYYTALYAPLLAPGVTANDLAVLLQIIKRMHAPLTGLRFDPMDPQTDGYRILSDALASSGFTPFTFFRFGNWYLRVQDDWPTYLQTRSGAVRSTIKRMGKKFAAAGGTLQIIEGGADLEKGLSAYQHVYALSWKKPEPYPGFVPGLIRACAAQGWLRLGVAWLNGQAVAAQLWIVANGKANIYKLAYDERFKKYASGTLLTAKLMAHVMELDKVSEIDYLIGDDPYKRDWMGARRERWGIIAYNAKSVAGFASWLVAALGACVRKMWSDPDTKKTS